MTRSKSFNTRSIPDQSRSVPFGFTFDLVNNSKKMQMVKMVSENAGGAHRRIGWPVKKKMKNKAILLCNICNFRHG